MPGLVPGIHVLLHLIKKDLDGRDKCLVRGHDVESAPFVARGVFSVWIWPAVLAGSAAEQYASAAVNAPAYAAWGRYDRLPAAPHPGSRESGRERGKSFPPPNDLGPAAAGSILGLAAAQKAAGEVPTQKARSGWRPVCKAAQARRRKPAGMFQVRRFCTAASRCRWRRRGLPCQAPRQRISQGRCRNSSAGRARHS
jgi:hypothetical protein